MDPEQAFVAALSSCHMLWFLHLAGRAPSAEEHLALHHAAHEWCFIANSVKTEILIEPC
jgi:organic hydroperoxide reductase OsmC/OhrA